MRFLLLIICIIVLSVAGLFVGSAPLPVARVLQVLQGGDTHSAAAFIVLGCRLPMVVTAMLGGASLATAGLLLQSAFRNPLAGPSVLGISSGASLGAALVLLLPAATAWLPEPGLAAAVTAGAFAGSLAITALLLALGRLLRSQLMLLICGMMTGYVASSLIMLLNHAASTQGIRDYVVWGMGTFGAVTPAQLPLFALMCLAGLFMSTLLIKPLDTLLLGDAYARSLGLRLHPTRLLILGTTGLLTAAVTAYCGPVAFLGLAAPHVARLAFPTDIHRTLLPAVMLTGAVLALACALVCSAAFDSTLPLNAVTPLIGAPVVVWVVIKNKSLAL